MLLGRQIYASVCNFRDMVLFLIYVDNIVLSSSNQGLIQNMIDKLHSTFTLKDLDVLNFFLGIEIVQGTDNFSSFPIGGHSSIAWKNAITWSKTN